MKDSAVEQDNASVMTSFSCQEPDSANLPFLRDLVAQWGTFLRHIKLGSWDESEPRDSAFTLVLGDTVELVHMIHTSLPCLETLKLSMMVINLKRRSVKPWAGQVKEVEIEIALGSSDYRWDRLPFFEMAHNIACIASPQSIINIWASEQIGGCEGCFELIAHDLGVVCEMTTQDFEDLVKFFLECAGPFPFLLCSQAHTACQALGTATAFDQRGRLRAARAVAAQA